MCCSSVLGHAHIKICYQDMGTYDRLLPLFWNKKWLSHYLLSVGWDEGRIWKHIKKERVARHNSGQRKLGISHELYTADRTSSTMFITEETKLLTGSLKLLKCCNQFQQLPMPAIYSPCSLYIVGGRWCWGKNWGGISPGPVTGG